MYYLIDSEIKLDIFLYPRIVLDIVFWVLWLLLELGTIGSGEGDRCILLHRLYVLFR